MEEWLTFISEIIKAIAWPAVVGVGLYMFGGELVKLLKEITKLKIGNVELERTLRQASVGLANSEAPPPVALPASEAPASAAEQAFPDFSPVNRLFAVADPTLVILQSWANVERAMKYIIERDSLQMAAIRATATAHNRTLATKGYIDKFTYQAINTLRTVRNSVAHGEGKATSDLTSEYVANTAMVLSRLKTARPGLYKDFQENRAMGAADDLKD